MKNILFQGDSITDTARDYVYHNNSGFGYATLVMSQLGLDNPGKYAFHNRGVSGNRIVDVLARVRNDIINLAPDYMSILIGVNDVWHELENKNGVNGKWFEIYYSLLIEQVRETLPNIKIMILEPFLLKSVATEPKWEEFRREVEIRAEIAKKIAQKYDLKFIPLMDKFDKLAEIAPMECITFDGVHPCSMGHELIKREWIKAFEEIKD